jgi:formate hydrogenlyase transcriptional activator
LDSAALAALHHQLDRLVDGTVDGIYAVDMTGRTTLVSPSVVTMTGREPGELVGAPIHDVLHHSHANGQHYPRETCPIYTACRRGHVEHARDVFWRKDGTPLPIEYTTAPLIQDGEVVGGIVLFRDLEAINQLREQVRSLAAALEPPPGLLAAPRVPLGQSAAWQQAMRLVERVARADTSVLILGESGTGKELVATAIHEGSPRRVRPFVKLNCAALPLSLVESELFGHERGAFTGAVTQRIGRFEQAGDGSIFLDEIGELPLEAQAKLLRVLQEHEFERVGGARVLRSRARVIAATNQDLEKLVTAGRFRADLYFRLAVFPLSLPPLRERREDIPLLARHFLRKLEPRLGVSLGELSPEIERRLVEHDWPGNVRELENVIERAALLADDGVIDLSALAPLVRDSASGRPPAIRDDLPARPESEATLLGALERAAWKVTGPRGAAAALGVHPNTLRYRMKRLGISRPRR